LDEELYDILYAFGFVTKLPKIRDEEWSAPMGDRLLGA
jgi:hypothetical protein